MISVSRYNLPKIRLLRLLEELKASSVEAGSLCVPPGYSLSRIEETVGTALDKNTVPPELSSSLAASLTGGMVIWGSDHWYLIIPPFPVNTERFSKTCEIDPLYSMMHQKYIIGLLLIRMGEYRISVIKGETVLSDNKGTGRVHSRHRQGGSSSHRFERHREKQIEMFFTRVCEHSREMLEPYTGMMDYVLYGGTRETIADFRKQCRFLHQLDKKTLERTLNIREPKSGLEEGIREAWSSQVIQWNGK